MKRIIQKRWNNVSLKTRICVMFFVFITVTVFTTAFLAYTRSSKIINRKLVDYNNDLLNEISANIEFKLDEIDQMTTTIFTNSVIQRNTVRLNSPFAGEYEKVLLSNAVESELINASAAYDSVLGVSLLSASGLEMKTSTVLSSFAMSQAERAVVDASEGKMVWMNELNGHWGVTGARVLYNLKTQRPMGYLVIRLREKALENILISKKYFRDGLICMVDGQYRLIVGNQGEPKSGMGWMAPYLQGASGSARIDAKRYVAYSGIKGTPWYVVSVLSSAPYESEIVQLRDWLLAIAPICALAIFLFAFWIASSMLRPLRELSETMKTVGEGNFNVDWKYPYGNEIGVIHDCFERMVLKISLLIEKSIEQQRLYHLAEINSLRMQINPHFIYNALDSIGWMAHSLGNDEMVLVINALGRYMRCTISGPEIIPLSEEIENVRNYLVIQKFRYADKLDFSIDIPEELMPLPLPRLILQPLVENAIVHGIDSKLGIGHIRMSGHVEHGTVCLAVEDDGVGMERDVMERVLREDPKEKRSIGLYNVHRRLQLHYGEEYGLTLSGGAGYGTRVEARIPYPGNS